MKSLILIALLAVPLFSSAQLKAKMADDHFKKMEYARCEKMYEELAAKHLKSKDKEDKGWEWVSRAGYCNLQLFEMQEAIGYYQLLKENTTLKEDVCINLIKALRYQANYKEAHQLALNSYGMYSDNLWLKELVENNSKLIEIIEDSLRYQLYDAGVNTGFGDFGATVFDSSMYFVTKSTNTRTIQQSYGWDDSYFLNIKKAKAATDTTFQQGTLLKSEFISPAHDGPISFSADGSKMLITRNTIEKIKGKKDIVRLSLYISELVENKWTKPVPFPFNAKTFNTGHGIFAENDSAIYFVSDRVGGFGDADIYVSRLKSDKTWGDPINLGEHVNTVGKEMFPFLVKNNLFFSSNGHFGLGGLDIFEYNIEQPSKAVNAGYPLNTSHDDFAVWTDSTGNFGYFSSNRGKNVDNIMAFKRVPLTIELQGIVYATYSERETIPNHPVFVKNETTGELDTLISNEFGQYSKLLRKNENYRVWTAKEEFILVKDGFASTFDIKRDSIIFCELPLKPTTLQIRLRVTERGTQKVIAFATTTITDYTQSKESVLYTDQDGLVTLKVERNKNYWAHGSKKGYIDDNVAFNSMNENDKIIDLELKLPPIVKGEIFKLDNIFYDLNKSTLRPESKLSLDKLADFILKNDVKIELSSHTDARGSDPYNLKLSQARAKSCVDYLISKGVKKASMIPKGYGETRLLNKCKNGVTCPEEEHQENRRTEVKIL
ncbi:MAG: OmpA family protein [Bacteroidota bacterium]